MVIFHQQQQPAGVPSGCLRQLASALPQTAMTSWGWVDNHHTVWKSTWVWQNTADTHPFMVTHLKMSLWYAFTLKVYFISSYLNVNNRERSRAISKKMRFILLDSIFDNDDVVYPSADVFSDAQPTVHHLLCSKQQTDAGRRCKLVNTVKHLSS